MWKNFHTNSSNWMSSEKQNYLTPSVSMSFEVDSSINEDYYHNISILPFEKESLKLNSNEIIKDLHKSDEVLVPEDNPRNNLSERNSKKEYSVNYFTPTQF
ncbi:hypothetical protein CEXT_122571 [Caerostris extrusa]|uniref:Uncharacterized protein n=1 Tax=Caerostris extrusa TaxID=172846 RepID=A0AAV4UJM7_CAEEX|nr:hypothetical protein CEXT_122571 [Caerostris extrusa]